MNFIYVNSSAKSKRSEERERGKEIKAQVKLISVIMIEMRI